MTFEELSKKLAAELKKELPGFSVQSKMDPISRKQPGEYLNASRSPKNSAVMVLLYPNEQTSVASVILIVRSEHEKGNHSGQISFPGGGVDEKDADLSSTALREMEEEIGVDRNSISVIGALSPLYIPVSNYLVHPFVGIATKRPVFKKNDREVNSLLEVAIHEFLTDKNRTTSDIFLKLRNQTMQVPCFSINGKIIWGATAMMLAEFSEVVRRIR